MPDGKRRKRVKKATKKASFRPRRDESNVPLFELSELRLDAGNPRLGAEVGKLRTQIRVLDRIVNKYGVDDVLSSLAVNGYFTEEPMVGRKAKEGREAVVRIADGNRRLAACLILAGDPRARSHEKRTREYQELQEKHDRPPIESVPVIVHDDPKELLSYMGVRHIAASQPWDSYAKAAWVAQVLGAGSVELSDVSEMIGDQHRTVARILEGFYFVNQLIGAAQFRPEDSLRRGRGSNPAYPFSWVYTALGYAPIRRWLGLPDLSEEPKQSPVARKHLNDAGELMMLLFGNKSRRRGAAIEDSREIADLARAVNDPSARRRLKAGKSVWEVMELGRPAMERVSEGLLEAQEALSSVLVALGEGEVTGKEARQLEEPSTRVVNLASEIQRKIIGLMTGRGEGKNA